MMAKLLESRLQVLELSCTDDFIYGARTSVLNDNILRVVFDKFQG